jgi:ferric-dicitrate binding protein FerR (iron transport regulator)
MHHQTDKILLQKFINNTCSEEELVLVRLFFQRPDAQELFNEVLAEEQLQQVEESVDAQQMQEWKWEFRERQKNTGVRTGRRVTMGQFLRVAAIFVGFSCSIWLVYAYLVKQEKLPGNRPVSIAVSQTRFLQLPDGSRVVLKADSRLEYNAAFNGKTREVTLVGEAYFDIHQDASRPFIIHTGKVNTKVLGTAFNIKAYPGQENIVVTVTQGKVQVEENTNVLAVLTPGKQVSYNTGTTLVKREEVKAEEKMAWVKQNMEFEATPFGEIVTRLRERYNVKIGFNNPALQQCPITASFTGAESLEEVLDILCLTRQASYEKTAGEILIKGEGCHQ